MLCNLKQIDGQALICIGIGINAVYISCNRLVKNKPNWLSFLMGAALGIAIFLMILGIVNVSR